jgi:hypothetical protein
MTMTEPRSLFLAGIGFVTLTQCAGAADPTPAKAPLAAPANAIAPAPAAPVSSAPPAPSATPATVAATGYPMCGGQRLPEAAPPARSGAVSRQLAPAFLDEMTTCKAEDALPKDVLARAGAGTIDAKGDCSFPSVGVSCHYHSGSEFITSSTKASPAGQGELHCIFPSEDPKSPRVFGAHVTCSDPKRGVPNASLSHAHGDHEVREGATCDANLLGQLASCTSTKCCDDGTLTGAIADLERDGKNDIRPDFRICEQSLSIDCSLLENMTAHLPNSPALGGVGKATFAVAPPKARPEAHAHMAVAKPQAEDRHPPHP